eukprot:TRINITY_DN4233_c1_g2_i5.p2 TRINITY_DN4233_c1_g2~~TRINITY_DN4233_c1_g2_i5.p2  ORF type:complete len:109 (+),score=19.09 TRINITY_DN4233_c1_g2_i5:105-431(+)
MRTPRVVLALAMFALLVFVGSIYHIARPPSVLPVDPLQQRSLLIADLKPAAHRLTAALSQGRVIGRAVDLDLAHFLPKAHGDVDAKAGADVDADVDVDADGGVICCGF